MYSNTKVALQLYKYLALPGKAAHKVSTANTKLEHIILQLDTKSLTHV